MLNKHDTNIALLLWLTTVVVACLWSVRSVSGLSLEDSDSLNDWDDSGMKSSGDILTCMLGAWTGVVQIQTCCCSLSTHTASSWTGASFKHGSLKAG